MKTFSVCRLTAYVPSLVPRGYQRNPPPLQCKHFASSSSWLPLLSRCPCQIPWEQLRHSLKTIPQDFEPKMGYPDLPIYFFSMALPAHSGLLPLIQLHDNFSQTVGLLGRVISPSQSLYLNIGQHKQNKRIHTTNIHALSGIRTHDLSVRASENSSCLKPGIDCTWLPCEAMFVVCLAKSIPSCRVRTCRVSSQIGAVLCHAAKRFQCVLLFQLRRNCGVPVFLSRQYGE
jgi:hypothetical protein